LPGTRIAGTPLFLEEISRDERGCEIFQHRKGGRLHQTRRRRQGRLRPYYDPREIRLERAPEGAKVTFDIVENRGKPVADNLRLK
jgi:hypothetical protein